MSEQIIRVPGKFVPFEAGTPLIDEKDIKKTSQVDSEDVKTEGGVLKFADKAYVPNDFSGMGKVYLRKNMINASLHFADIISDLPSTETETLFDCDEIVYETTNNRFLAVKHTSEGKKYYPNYQFTGSEVYSEPDDKHIYVCDANAKLYTYKNGALEETTTLMDKNVLTQDMINKPNTIYIIQYDYDIVDMVNDTTTNNLTIGGEYYSYKSITIEDNQTYRALNDCVFIDYHHNSLIGSVLVTGEKESQDFAIAKKSSAASGVSVSYYKPEGTINVPANCVLQFEGGSIKSGTIVGQASIITSPPIKIFENITLNGTFNCEFFTEWLGAKGDGSTNDTEAFQKLDGKTIRLLNKTYRVSNVIYGANTAVLGTSIQHSVIKQTDGATGTMFLLKNWNGGIFRDVTIMGGDNFHEDNTSYRFDVTTEIPIPGTDAVVMGTCSDALVKIVCVETQNSTPVEGQLEGSGHSYYSCFDNVKLWKAPCNGLVCLGNGITEHEYTTSWNWVFNIRNTYIMHCKYYGIYNLSSDNKFENLYVHHCGYANIVEGGSSNLWNTIKCDGVSGAGYNQEIIKDNDLENSLAGLLSSRVYGTLFMIKGASTSIINNLDLQSSAVAGLKIIKGNSEYATPVGLNISLSVNNCGVAKNIPYLLRKKYTPGVYCAEIIGSKINITSINGAKQVTTFICPTPDKVVNNEISIIENSGTKSLVDTNFSGSQYDISGNNIVSSGVNVGKLQKAIMKNLLPDDMHKCDNITTTGTKSTQDTIFDGYTDVLLDYASINHTCYTNLVNGNKGTHVYLALAVVKINRLSSLQLTDTGILKIPYISILGNYNNAQAQVKATAVNYSTEAISVGDKVIISRLTQFSVDDDIKLNVAVGADRSYNDGSFTVTNLSLYDLTENLGITEVNTRIYNQELLYNILRYSKLYDVESPINTFETEFVSEYVQLNAVKAVRATARPILDTKFFVGTDIFDLDLNKRLTLTNKANSTPFVTEDVTDGMVFIENNLDMDTLYYLSVVNSAWWTSEIFFAKTNINPESTDLVSIYRGPSIAKKAFFALDKTAYPYIALWTNKTDYPVTFNIYSAEGKFTEYDGIVAGVKRIGTTTDRVAIDVADIYEGFVFFDKTLNLQCTFINDRWVNGNGYTPAITKGLMADRPTDVLVESDNGYPYYCTDVHKTIYFEVANNVKTWYYADGTEVVVENGE